MNDDTTPTENAPQTLTLPDDEGWWWMWDQEINQWIIVEVVIWETGEGGTNKKMFSTLWDGGEDIPQGRYVAAIEPPPPPPPTR